MLSRQVESSANNALAEILRQMMPMCRVYSEATRTISHQAGRRPDILVTAAGRAPVVIEAEYEPADEVEQDAAARLGRQVEGESRPIESAIALRYPETVRSAYDLADAVGSARLSYCALYAKPPGSRFPESGWLTGSVSDLADLVRLVSVSQSEVDAAADAMEEGIERVAVILDEMNDERPAITAAIAGLLGMVNVPQTRRMACAIIANAMIFHDRLAGMREEVKPLHLVCGRDVANPHSETLAAWAGILDINYFPIFAIGRDILNQVPPQDAARILNTLELTAGSVNSAGVANSHDLTGRIFQRLIADRKYLATFYTLPASAALLARLAVAKMEGVDWGDAESIGGLRIGDFACGTGALLSAVYEQIATRHERAGGNPATLHTAMMEDTLYGCDVMPSAVHITTSTLAGAQPRVGFENSRIYTPTYGGGGRWRCCHRLTRGAR